MNDALPESRAAVGLSRIFVAGVSAAAIIAGVIIVLTQQGFAFAGGIVAILAGVVGLLRAIAKGPTAPVQSATDVVEIFGEHHD